MKPRIKVFPSLFAADFGRLADEAKRLEDAGADGIHMDIMDGHFVPNLTLGPKALAAVNRATSLFLDVHIMVYNPFDLIEKLVESGADQITFHIEATEEVEEILRYIRTCNVRAGLAFNPSTSSSLVMPYIGKADTLLAMSVNPGFGGQAFIPEVLEKIEDLHQEIQVRKQDTWLEVDGGVNNTTAPMAKKAGANVLVVGTYLFQQKDLQSTILALKDE